MEDNIISFSTKVKKEVLLIKPQTKNEIISELYGIFLSKGAIIKEGVNFKTEISYLARRIVENLKKIEIFDFKFNYIKKNMIIYEIKIQNFKIAQSNLDNTWVFKGIFLAGGYIKDPIKGYSMDFFIESKDSAKYLFNLLNEWGKKAFYSEKKDTNLIYVRNCEDILDLLIDLSAQKSFFYYQNSSINKEINLKINRNMNYEIANEAKKLSTSMKQIELIRKIDKTIGLNNINENLREVAILRIKNEDASLQELANKLNISKSGLRNRFRRLKEIYDEIESANGKVYFKK